MSTLFTRSRNHHKFPFIFQGALNHCQATVRPIDCFVFERYRLFWTREAIPQFWSWLVFSVDLFLQPFSSSIFRILRKVPQSSGLRCGRSCPWHRYQLYHDGGREGELQRPLRVPEFGSCSSPFVCAAHQSFFARHRKTDGDHHGIPAIRDLIHLLSSFSFIGLL